jgi:hypothetical protein
MPLYSSQTEDIQGLYGQPSFTDHTGEATGALSRVFNRLSKFATFDKQKIAKVGVAFAVTYNFISNINGSISLSLAWYIASKRVSVRRLERISLSSRVSANFFFLFADWLVTSSAWTMENPFGSVRRSLSLHHYYETIEGCFGPLPD